jgi:hypothetical protein
MDSRSRNQSNYKVCARNPPFVSRLDKSLKVSLASKPPASSYIGHPLATPVGRVAYLFSLQALFDLDLNKIGFAAEVFHSQFVIKIFLG